MPGAFSNLQFPELFDCLPMISARDLGAAANEGLWIRPSNFSRFWMFLAQGISTSGDDLTLTWEQASDSSGTDKEDLTWRRYRIKQPATAGPLLSGAVWEIVDLDPPSNTITGAWGNTENLLFFDVEDGIFADNKEWLKASINDTGSNVQGGCMFAFGERLRGGKENDPAYMI